MSHKSHATAYTMNLSTHSINSGTDSPTRRMYDKIAALKSALSPRPSTGGSTSKVVPIDDSCGEVVVRVASPNQIEDGNIFSSQTSCASLDDNESHRVKHDEMELLRQASLRLQCANFLGRVNNKGGDAVREFSSPDLEMEDLEAGGGARDSEM
jgi:hypothetical protein